MARLNLPRLRAAVALKPLEKFAPPPEPTVKPTATLYKAYTYFTVPGETKLLYTAETWVRARLFLEDAGPVSVGDTQNITPVLSGKGTLLPTEEWWEIELTKGSRIFIAAEAINRVKFSVSPIPFIEQLGMALNGIINLLSAVAGRK